MSNHPILASLGLDLQDVSRITQNALAGGTGGEAYFSKSRSMGISLSDGIIQAPSLGSDAGASLRRINGLMTDFVSFAGLSAPQLQQAAAEFSSSLPLGKAVQLPGSTGKGTPHAELLYPEASLFAGKTDADWRNLLKQVDTYVRDADSRVRQVTVSLGAMEEDVLIVRADGRHVIDHRPLVRLVVGVVLEDNGRRESGSGNYGGRILLPDVFANWKEAADNALKVARNSLDAIPAPAGDDFDIVIGNGWGGVILHEAFGHGLEADFHMKGIASFQGMLGKRIAAPGVNIVDDGTLAGKRGSLNVDDEGNPTRCNMLVEDGILVGLINDEVSAAALGLALTGNGRRQGYSSKPMPRMTNTYMLAGDATPADLFSGVKKGIYCTSFSGGQVDITSGKFVFDANEARLIENGKLGPYIKGASLSGMGDTAYMKVDAVANDLDHGDGNCGKAGQTVPVCVGQPSIRIRAGAISVGGTA